MDYDTNYYSISDLILNNIKYIQLKTLHAFSKLQTNTLDNVVPVCYIVPKKMYPCIARKIKFM